MTKTSRRNPSRRSDLPIQGQLPFTVVELPPLRTRPAHRLSGLPTATGDGQPGEAPTFEAQSSEARSCEVPAFEVPEPATGQRGVVDPRTARRGPFRRVSLEHAAHADAGRADLESGTQAAQPRTSLPTVAAESSQAGGGRTLHLERVPAREAPALQLVGVAFTFATFLAAALWL